MTGGWIIYSVPAGLPSFGIISVSAGLVLVTTIHHCILAVFTTANAYRTEVRGIPEFGRFFDASTGTMGPTTSLRQAWMSVLQHAPVLAGAKGI
jgi:hypothetical protein